jgi:hypothetical protein
MSRQIMFKLTARCAPYDDFIVNVDEDATEEEFQETIDGLRKVLVEDNSGDVVSMETAEGRMIIVRVSDIILIREV